MLYRMIYMKQDDAGESNRGLKSEWHTGKDGSVRVCSSIQWSSPEVEQHGEKN